MVARRPAHLFLALPSSMALSEQGPRQSVTMALSMHARAAEAAAGLGVGASQASLLRTMMSSMAQMAMPLLYGQLYVWRGGAPWAVAAACGVLAQGIFTLVSDADVAAVESSCGGGGGGGGGTTRACKQT